MPDQNQPCVVFRGKKKKEEPVMCKPVSSVHAKMLRSLAIGWSQSSRIVFGSVQLVFHSGTLVV
jgi:hypothetical protein